MRQCGTRQMIDLKSFPALISATRAGQDYARVGVLLAALLAPGPALPAAQGVEEGLQVVAVKVGPAEYQALLHPAMPNTMDSEGLRMGS